MRLIASVLMGLVVAFAASSASAQGYPNRPIRLIVGFLPGGTNDVLPRIVSPQLSERLRQPVMVENKPGADAVIATEYVAKSTPDGYTLLICSSGQMVYNPLLVPRLPYDPVKDFIPITMFATDPLVFAVNPSVNAKNVLELIALAKAKPGQLFYSAAAPPFFVAAETFKKLAGVEITHVPYKGSAAAANAAVAGEVALYVGSVAPALSQIRAGRLRALAVTSDKRDPVLPDVPTVRESGLDFEGGQWTGLCAPAGTPSAIIDKLYSELSAILKSDGMKKHFATLGYDTTAMGMSPTDMSAFHREQLAKWAKAIKDHNIRPN